MGLDASVEYHTSLPALQSCPNSSCYCGAAAYTGLLVSTVTVSRVRGEGVARAN